MITDTDGCTNSASEADKCVGHGPASEPSNHRWCSFGMAAVLLAALIGAGVFLPWPFGQVPVNAFLSAAQLADEQAIQNFVEKAGIGCENWKNIALGKAVERESAAQCQLECVATHGCMYSNYQPAACSGHAQTGPKMCYLFAGKCVEENNTCWDLYETSLATPFPFESPKKGTGCSNWKELKIGPATIVLNEFECGSLCQKEEECSGFNFQPSHCSGKRQVGKGACYLFREGCKQEESRCWDLYVSAPNPPYIYADGLTPTALPKKVIDHSPLHMFYSMPLDVNTDVQVNSTHYFIPNNATISAVYIRNTTVDASPGWLLDYGVANWKAFFNPVSIFPHVNFGVAEKLIRFGREGADSVLPETDDAPDMKGDVSPDQTFQRNLLVNSLVLQSRMGMAAAAASLDTQQLAMVAALAANGSPEIDPQLAELADKLKSMAGGFKDNDVTLKSSNNCHHWANAPVTDQGLALPLGKPWLSYKGLITFEKHAGEFWCALGTTTVNFNAEANTLEVFFSAASTVLLGEIDSVAVSGVYYQGHPHTATDNRIQVQQPSLEDNALFQQIIAIPQDDRQFWRDGACPPDKEAHIDGMLSATNFSAMILEELSKEEVLERLIVATRALDCGQSYMQSSIPDSHGYGSMEGFVWMHMILETPQSFIGTAATWRGWNEVDVVNSY